MKPVTVGQIERAIATALPPEWSEEWDRGGLLAGDPEREVTGVALALDPTRAAIAQAAHRGANVLVTHHPAFLTPPSSIRPGRGAGGVLFAAMDAGVALINAHTNLDRAPAAGLLLPRALGLKTLKPIERRTMPVSLVSVYVPSSDADKVLDAMLGAGAGRIGEYEGCSYVSAEGTGSYVPRADTAPTVGSPGVRTATSEVRLEVIAPRARARGVVSAARSAHPYEEPLVVSADVEIARASARMGMLCAPTGPLTLETLAETASASFGITPRVWGAPGTQVTRVATATGSAGSLISDVLSSGAQALVAGEVRYHDALDALEAGLCIIEVGHDVSEWPLVALLDQVVRGVDGIDPHAIHMLSSEPGWWTPRQGRPA